MENDEPDYSPTMDEKGTITRYHKIKIEGPDWRAIADELAEALKEIEATKDKTLLGRCCVNEACFTDENGCSATITAHNAFYANACIASGALEKYEKAKRII